MAGAPAATVTLEQARWSLARLWFIAAGLLFAVLIVQSLAGVYEDQVKAVWGWALPNLMPTLSLMIGVFAAGAIQPSAPQPPQNVSRRFMRLTFGISAFHLAAVTVTLLAHPFSGAILGPRDDPMALFEMSNLWLGLFQGLVAALIGALFFSGKPGKGGEQEKTERK
jgi:hypothetical protein